MEQTLTPVGAVPSLDGPHTPVTGGKALDAPAAGVSRWPCTGGADQHWTVRRLASGAYTVASLRSGLLLTTASTADGAAVTQQPDSGSALQQWTIG
ncbi:RICIN domain-containing protein [Streptomyces sp. NPDC003487]